MDYLWAPRHFDLVPALIEYDKKIASSLPRENLTYIVFAGFWEDQSTVPSDYLEVLDAIRERAKLLIVMGVPLVSLITSDWRAHVCKGIPRQPCQACSLTSLTSIERDNCELPHKKSCYLDLLWPREGGIACQNSSMRH